MTRRMCVSTVCALAAGIVVLSISGCVASPANSTRADSFTVGGSATLVVDSLNGRIQIQGGSGSKVDVQATLRDTAGLRYEAVQNGDQVTVTAAGTGGWQLFGHHAGADITVSVPAGTVLNLKTSNGEISVQGTTRGGVLKTSNGKISLKNIKGDFDGSTRNGRIEVTGLEGSGLFKTSNGRIEVQGLVGSCNASSSNGLISFVGEMKPGTQNRFTTSNGAVSVQLQGTPGVTLDASTSNGKVSSALPITATQTGSTSLAGKIGDGAASLYIRTSNGSISIK